MKKVWIANWSYTKWDSAWDSDSDTKVFETEGQAKRYVNEMSERFATKFPDWINSVKTDSRCEFHPRNDLFSDNSATVFYFSALMYEKGDY